MCLCVWSCVELCVSVCGCVCAVLVNEVTSWLRLFLSIIGSDLGSGSVKWISDIMLKPTYISLNYITGEDMYYVFLSP